MVVATPNEVVSSTALSAILEIYEIGGTGIFGKTFRIFWKSLRNFLRNLDKLGIKFV